MAFLYLAAEYQIRLIVKPKKYKHSRMWKGVIWGAYNTDTGLFAPGLGKEAVGDMTDTCGVYWEKLSESEMPGKEYFVLKFNKYLKGKNNAGFTDTNEKETKRITNPRMSKVRKDVVPV